MTLDQSPLCPLELLPPGRPDGATDQGVLTDLATQEVEQVTSFIVLIKQFHSRVRLKRNEFTDPTCEVYKSIR